MSSHESIIAINHGELRNADTKEHPWLHFQGQGTNLSYSRKSSNAPQGIRAVFMAIIMKQMLEHTPERILNTI